MMTRKRIVLWCNLAYVILASTLLPAPTTASIPDASVGGPRLAEILGYDSADQKVYYLYDWRDQTGRLPQLYYFSLGSPQPGHGVTVKSWYPDGVYLTDRNTLYRRIKKLRDRLVPLPQSTTDTLSLNVALTKSDKYQIAYGPVPRFFMNIELMNRSLKARFDIVAYCRRGVGVVDWYQVPGGKYAVANFTYTGDPFEACYETQTVVLLSDVEATESQ